MSPTNESGVLVQTPEGSRTIFAVIMYKNSSKSIVPEPSLSMSVIIFLISSCQDTVPVRKETGNRSLPTTARPIITGQAWLRVCATGNLALRATLAGSCVTACERSVPFWARNRERASQP
eukprot:scaffold109495_cov26-Tisochrysis_lutea.AAC.2